MTKEEIDKEIDKEIENWQRAGGECICPICGKTYLQHPYSEDVLMYWTEFYLNKLCDGTYVKL